jgi:putative ABC transport system permease protein
LTILIIQRTAQIGLLKALGASSWYVMRDGLGQMTIVVSLATAIGALVGASIDWLLQGGSAPVLLSVSGVVRTAALLIIMGIIGSLVPFRRITGIQPSIALRAGS